MKTEIENVVSEVAEVAEVQAVGIQLLNPKAKLPEIVAKLNEIIELMNVEQPKARDRGLNPLGKCQRTTLEGSFSEI